MTPISLRAYAKHRAAKGLPGNAMAVSLAIKAERLVKSVVRVDGVPKIADVELADREWEENTDHQRRFNAEGGARPQVLVQAPAPLPVSAALELLAVPQPPPMPRLPADAPPAGELSLASAAARSKHWEAELRELNFRKAAGELVPVKDVQRKLIDMITASKTHLLAIPSRAVQAMPHLTPADLATIEGLVREALEQLADGEA